MFLATVLLDVGCTKTTTRTLNKKDHPTATITSANSIPICPESQATLTATIGGTTLGNSGQKEYTWLRDTGGGIGSAAIVSQSESDEFKTNVAGTYYFRVRSLLSVVCL